MEIQHSEIEILENVKRYFENSGIVGKKCLNMAIIAVAKAQNELYGEQYGVCSCCGHQATKEEIHIRPFFCAKCGEPFV